MPGIAEEILSELKRLNKNLEATNAELATVPTVNARPKSISDQPQTSEIKEEQVEVEEKQEESKFTIDDVKRHAKEFLQKGDASDKKALKDKLTELGAGKVSDLKPTQYEEVIEFFMDRLS